MYDPIAPIDLIIVPLRHHTQLPLFVCRLDFLIIVIFENMYFTR